jgi:imipenem/basic amino acid-specific outer membrane pore
MKLVKMSLLAATLIASSAFAIDNVKVSGDAMLFYGTNDGFDTGFNSSSDAALFGKEYSWGQTSLGLGVTADITEGISSGVHVTAISAMGLTNIVSGVFEGGLTDEYWFDEAWLAGTYGKTTVKVGRMTLDTPLAFTETWSVAYNTFEAGVLINEDIPDTTLVAAYIGEGNNGNAMGQWGTGQYAGVTADWDGSQNTTFGLVNDGKGAYAIGAVNNSWTPLTVQGWYYNLPSTATAYWLQGDLAFDMGLTAGVQVAGIDANVAAGDSSNIAYAGKVGYEMKETFAVSAAGSQVGENDNGIGAGFNVFGAQSKLYTEAWWNFTYVGRPDTTTINVTATTPEELTYVALGVYATQASVGDNGGVAAKVDMSEVTLEVAKSFGPLDAGLYYIFTDADDQNNGDAYNSIQAYFTYNF